MVKIILLIALLLWPSIGFAKDKINCPDVVPVIDMYGNLLDLLDEGDPLLVEPRKGCQAGKGGVSLPCVYRIIVLNEERATIQCGPGEVLTEL